MNFLLSPCRTLNTERIFTVNSLNREQLCQMRLFGCQGRNFNPSWSSAAAALPLLPLMDAYPGDTKPFHLLEVSNLCFVPVQLHHNQLKFSLKRRMWFCPMFEFDPTSLPGGVPPNCSWSRGAGASRGTWLAHGPGKSVAAMETAWNWEIN